MPPATPGVEMLRAEELEMNLSRPLRYVEDRCLADRVGLAFREGRPLILQSEAKPWKMNLFSALTDATSFLVAARYYMKLDAETKREFFRPVSAQLSSASGSVLEPEVVELPGKECVHISKAMVDAPSARPGADCAARAAFRGFERLARAVLMALQASEPGFQPLPQAQRLGYAIDMFSGGAGTYRDRLKPLIDASDQHVLSIFSYSGDACGDHVDRGLLTLVTNQDGALQIFQHGAWVQVPATEGLVVFAGKTLELLTRGAYRAVVHRLAPGRAAGRTSLAFKLRAPTGAVVELDGERSTLGELFEKHLDRPGLSINQPNHRAALQRPLRMPAADPGASRAAPDTADAAASACTGDAKATQLGLGVCTKLAYHSQVITVPIFHSLELQSFLRSRATCRDWHRDSTSCECCWVRFCLTLGIPWLQRQLDWPLYLSDWQKKFYIWRHQKPIRAVPLRTPFTMSVGPSPAVCRTMRLSAAIEKWGLTGFSEIKFYRPEEGRSPVNLECLGIWDGALLRQRYQEDDLDRVDFERHGGTAWDPFLGEFQLTDHINFHIVMLAGRGGVFLPNHLCRAEGLVDAPEKRRMAHPTAEGRKWDGHEWGTGRRPSAAPAAQMAESEPSRPRRFTFSEGPEAPGASPSASAPSTVPVPRVVPPSLSPSTSSGAVPRLGGFSSTPPTPVRPQHVPPVHHSQWSSQQQPQQQSSWGGWGGDGWGGDWGWEDSPCAAAAAMWAAWGKGGGGFGGPPSCDGGVNMMIGTVKSYSAVKGFGFMIHPDISQDIWFAKETVAAEYRTSDLAGTTMSFEIFRAPDGKPQARNLRPAPAGVGMPPPPVNPNQHMPAGFPTPVPGLVRPGFPHPLLRPGFPNPLLRPAVPGMAVPSQPKRRAWSPHAGSRAIATASMDEEVPGMGGPVAEPVEKKSESEEKSPESSSRRSSESSDSSSERKKKKKKKKDKKKKKKKKKKSKKSDVSDVCSSSSLEEVRSRSRSPKKVEVKGNSKDKAKSTPEIEQAKLEALEKLRKLQSLEPKEARAKEWRALLRDWHPDKNPDKVEVAKEVFQFLQKGKTIINV
ncbi:1-aminocyclopropane-1-carboxylate oxidase 1 (ACC oxidase 1) (Ethylene-forming enzyme) (EFE) [Durusdinium trenchii]|uniref:1-aminocyclopropane-1-carboxylate oxidase 1 (ACC oxidase 1) (Ethylene-forming enzyme) (EFE) n=1 Tax=Durusdinium trenchii TaxID=1381693 RepID=A0ABP0HVU3_9DINO